MYLRTTASTGCSQHETIKYAVVIYVSLVFTNLTDNLFQYINNFSNTQTDATQLFKYSSIPAGFLDCFIF